VDFEAPADHVEEEAAAASSVGAGVPMEPPSDDEEEPISTEAFTAFTGSGQSLKQRKGKAAAAPAAAEEDTPMPTAEPRRALLPTCMALESALECPVCLERFRRPVLLNCGHSLCTPCASSLAQGRQSISCPTCRQSTPLEQGILSLKQNFGLEAVLDAQTEGTSRIEPVAASTSDDADVKVLVQFGDVKRLLFVPVKTNLESFRIGALAQFGLIQGVLKFHDQDQQLCSLRTRDDFELAKKLVVSGTLSELCITVLDRPPSPLPDAGPEEEEVPIPVVRAPVVTQNSQQPPTGHHVATRLALRQQQEMVVHSHSRLLHLADLRGCDLGRCVRLCLGPANKQNKAL